MNLEFSRDFAIRSTRVVTRDGVRDAVLRIRDGVIVDVASPGLAPSEGLLDAGDLIISPGVVDPHVHINDPGRASWEGFETATQAAAAGGVTTLVDMPLNSTPVTTNSESLAAKLHAAGGKLHVDCGFHGGLVPANAHDIKPLLDSGVLGVKAFLVHSGIDEFPNVAEQELRKAMPFIALSGVPLLVHCELADLNTGAAGPAPTSSRIYSEYLASRPRLWEDNAIALMIRLSKEFGCRVHIVHLSSSNSVRQLIDARSAGLPVTVETCPHYLCFTAEEIADGDTRLKCAPPVRERENNELLWQALKDGVIDMIASDHSPCPPEMKLAETGDFMKAWGGISSLQFGLSIIWTEARKRGFGVHDIVKWMSSSPAKLLGLSSKKGTIAPGFDADFVVWDPDESFVVKQSIVCHRHKLTPYEGKTLTGLVHSTYVRGIKVFEGGRFGAASGSVILRRPA